MIENFNFSQWFSINKAAYTEDEFQAHKRTLDAKFDKKMEELKTREKKIHEKEQQDLDFDWFILSLRKSKEFIFQNPKLFKLENEQLTNERRKIEVMKSESIKIAQVQASNEEEFLAEKAQFENFRKDEMNWLNAEKERVVKIYDENMNFKVFFLFRNLRNLLFIQ